MTAGLYLLTLIFFLSGPIQSSSAPSQERDILPREFVKARPAKAGVVRPRRVRYRSVRTASPTQTSLAPATQLGLTIWRLRPAAIAEIGERVIIQEDGQEDGEIVEWIPERIEAGTPLRIGEKLRLSFESQQPGYLYLVNRELYADGSLGDPLLIFPTTRARNGDNRVAAGRLIEIPAQDDRPNFFITRRGRLDQIGEQLIALITPEPLKDLVISAKPLKLTDDVLRNWEQSWSATTEQFELVDAGVRTWTRIEREAGADAARSLMQDDPAPQTIFRVALGADQPRLIKLILGYTTPKPMTRPAKQYQLRITR